MFWKAWKPNQQAMPAAQTRPKTSSARRAMTRARQITTPSSAMSTPGTEQAQLLPRDREDEVGLLLGHEAGPGLGAVEEPLAEQAAVADRDPGLLDVVARAARVERRVDEGEEPVDLVGLQHAGGHRRERAAHRAADEQDQPAAPGAGDGEHAEDGRAEDEHRAQVGLHEDQHRRARRRQRASARRRPRRRTAAAAPRSAPRGRAPCRRRPRAWRARTAGSTGRRAGATTATR